MSPSPAPDVSWILWSGTLGLESPFLDRLPAAVAGGYDLLSISPLDVERESAQGRGPDELRRRAADAGLGLIMDPVLNWHPATEPAPSRFVRFQVDDVLDMCAALGVVSLSAVASVASDLEVTGLAEHFGALCDRAARFGARVHLEFIPMTVVPDVATAWEIVSAADRPNGGFLFDTWHFFRGNPDFETLESVPGERIFAVQVDDAAEHIEGTMWQDTLHRRLPGQGIFDLPRAMGALARIGGLTVVGPEVISPELEAMPMVQAAQISGELVRDLVATAMAQSAASTAH